MRGPLDRDLLDAWERGQAHPPGVRALLLLRAAWPDRSTDELARLPFGRRNALLLQLRVGCLGDELGGVAHCPHCGDAAQVHLTPARLGLGPDVAVDAAVADAEVHRLVHGAYELRFRLPTSADARGLDPGTDPADLARAMLERCLLDVRRAGVALAPSELPAAAIEAVAAEIERLDPHAVIELVLECVACGQPWEQPFDVADFVWTELAARARWVLADVARLAMAFGWSEAEILALPPRRRQSYLELIEA